MRGFVGFEMNDFRLIRPQDPKPPLRWMPPKGPSSSSSASDHDEASLPSSPSPPRDAASESDLSPSDDPSGSDSDGRQSKNPRGPWRTWPAADEIALLEAAADHRASHGRLPTPEDLLAALRGRLQMGCRDAEDFPKRMRALRARYDAAARRLSRGAVPVKDDDVRIYQLSKLVWGGWQRGAAAATAEVGDGQPKRARNTPSEQKREFAELAWLYPTLAGEVEVLELKHPCGALLKRAFGRIGDEKGRELEGKVKMHRLAEFKMRMKAEEMRKEVTMALLELVD